MTYTAETSPDNFMTHRLLEKVKMMILEIEGFYYKIE